MATRKNGAKRPAENSGAVRRGPPRGRPFPKGVSGNPGGRPKELAEVKALAAEHTRDAIEALHDIAMGGEDERARVSAAVALLDRAWGKPAQLAEISGPNGGPLQVSGWADLVAVARAAGPGDTDGETG